MDDARIAFENALACTGFSPPECQAFIAQSGYTNMSMLGLCHMIKLARSEND